MKRNKKVLLFITSVGVLFLSIIFFTLYENYDDIRTTKKLNEMTPADLADNADKKIKAAEANESLTADDYSEIGSLHERKAHLLHKETELDKALESYKKALDIEPNHALTVYRMGNTYIELKDFDKALEFRKKSVGLEPNNPVDHSSLADILVLTDLDRALQEAKKALVLAKEEKDSEDISFNEGKVKGIKHLQEDPLTWGGYSTFFDDYYTDYDLQVALINKLLKQNVSPKVEKELKSIKKEALKYVALPDKETR